MKIDEHSETIDLFSSDFSLASTNKNTATNPISEINLFFDCPQNSIISKSIQNFDNYSVLDNYNIFTYKGIEEEISSSISKYYSENNPYVNGSKNIRQNEEVLPDSYNQKKSDVIFLNKKRKNFNIFAPGENEDESYSRNNFKIFTPGENEDARKLINEVKKSNIKYYYYENNNSKKNILEDRRMSQDYERGKGRKKKNIFIRKDGTDSRLKRVKSGFHKKLFEKTNELFKERYKKEIKRLPQSFISNATKKMNKLMMKKTYKDLLLFDFESKKDVDLRNYESNKEVISYLEKKNFEHCEFVNMTYEQIFNEYLNSKEFENEIDHLIEIEQIEYVKNYIIKAINYISYYTQI